VVRPHNLRCPYYEPLVWFMIQHKFYTTNSFTFSFIIPHTSILGGGIDYNDVLVNVTFPAGSTSQVVTVNLNDDGILEPTEQFTIEIIGVYHEGDETVPCLLDGLVLMASGEILSNESKYCI